MWLKGRHIERQLFSLYLIPTSQYSLDNNIDKILVNPLHPHTISLHYLHIKPKRKIKIWETNYYEAYMNQTCYIYILWKQLARLDIIIHERKIIIIKQKRSKHLILKMMCHYGCGGTTFVGCEVLPLVRIVLILL